MNTDTLHLHGWSEIPIVSKHMANPITEHGPGHYGKELTKPHSVTAMLIHLEQVYWKT